MSSGESQKLRLLLFNLETDADHPILGFTTTWINALAEHCDYIDVVTMHRGRIAVADNVDVYSVGKERGYSRTRRVVEFYRILVRLLGKRRYDVCFAHMMPLFAVMGVPLLKLRRIPITLWYTHKSVTVMLHLAERLVEQVVTASPESFRIESKKKRVIGHGIDTDVFAPARGLRPVDRPFTILSVSRIAPVKGLEALIEATRLLVHEHGMSAFRVRLVGNFYPQDEGHNRRLRQLVAAHDLRQIVEFAGPVPHGQVPQEYHRADVFVNLSRTGSLDKAVLEAMSCGVPVITSNEAFYSILATWAEMLLVPADSPVELSRKLKDLGGQSAARRQEIGVALRRIVVNNHSLDNLTRVLVACFPTSPRLNSAE